MSLAGYRAKVKEIVKLAMARADEARGEKELVQGAALADLLAKELDGEGVIGYKTIQGYARGDIKNPPGPVLLAIAKVTEISLDKYLFGEEAGLLEQLADLQRRVRHLEGEG